MKFRILAPILLTIFCVFAFSNSRLEARPIEFRLVLTDAEAFSQSFEHYLFKPSDTAPARDVTVANKPFLSNADVGSIEITPSDHGTVGRPVLNMLFTKESLEKFLAFKEVYGGREAAVLYGGQVFTVLRIPNTKVRGLVFYSSRITTTEAAVQFCESIGIKPVIRQPKTPSRSTQASSAPAVRQLKVLVS